MYRWPNVSSHTYVSLDLKQKHPFHNTFNDTVVTCVTRPTHTLTHSLTHSCHHNYCAVNCTSYTPSVTAMTSARAIRTERPTRCIG